MPISRTGWKGHFSNSSRAACHNSAVVSVGPGSVLERLIVWKSPKRIFSDTPPRVEAVLTQTKANLLGLVQ